MGSVTKISILSGLGVALYTVENVLPVPLPWLRIGLSNVAVILGLYLTGFRGGFWVLILKVLLGSLIFGRFLSPFFFFALSGGTSALLVMALGKRLLSPPLSIVGVSMLGGVAHNLAQLTLAYSLLFPLPQLLFLTPILVLLGLVSGSIIGIISAMVLEKILKEEKWRSEESVS